MAYEFKIDENGNIILTKEEAINEHRKMWDWVANKIEEKNEYITELDYIRDELGIGVSHLYSDGNDGIRLKVNAFLCEYAIQKGQEELKKGNIKEDEHYYCEYCPLDWGGKNKTIMQCMDKDKENEGKGLYKEFLCASLNDKSKIARQIANLKEM